MTKGKSDRTKLHTLGKMAVVCAAIRLFIFLLPVSFGGLIVEILWIPLVLFVLAIPFYIIEAWLFRHNKERS